MTKTIFNWLGILVLALTSSVAFSDNHSPSRSEIDATVNKMNQLWDAGDMEAWVGLFASDASFLNSSLAEPVVGREAILAMSREWPEVENIREWQVIEGNRMAIGWRERGIRPDGKKGGWYRGMSTFVFGAGGLITDYEGSFNFEAVRKAYEQTSE